MGRSGKVDFVGIGVQRSATSWLAACLKEHPEIGYAKIPEGKEIFFFNELDRHYLKYRNEKYYWGLEWYLSHFKHCRNDQVVGEISPTYLYGRVTVERIKKHFPEVKIIVILRDPVERAFSQYLHDRARGVIGNISFERALRENSSLIEKSRYCKHLKNYFELFPRKNILVLFQEDVKGNKRRLLVRVYKFLGLKDVEFIPRVIDKRVNPSARQVIPGLNNMLLGAEYWMKKNNLWWLIRLLETLRTRKLAFWVSDSLNLVAYDVKPVMKARTERSLRKLLRSDIDCLERMLKVDLGRWK